jgi:hypothetical protein
MHKLGARIAAFLLLGTVAASQAQVPLKASHCAQSKVSSIAQPAAPLDPQASLDSLFRAQPRSSGLTDNCLPSGVTCVYYASGDCLTCFNDLGQWGTYICDSWVCPPYGSLYTCCSECERFTC